METTPELEVFLVSTPRDINRDPEWVAVSNPATLTIEAVAKALEQLARRSSYPVDSTQISVQFGKRNLRANVSDMFRQDPAQLARLIAKGIESARQQRDDAEKTT